jgi:flagellar FliL protein
MAEQPKEKAEKKSDGGGGGNKLMLLVILLLLVVLAAVGGLAFYVLTAKPGAVGGAHAEKSSEEKPKKKHEGPPIFEKLEPFVVNLSGNGGAMLQVEMQAELSDEKTREKFKDYTPKIRSALILLLSSKSPAELATPDGKVKLRAQIKKIVNEAMDAGDDTPVESVLFTSFIIQQQ